MAVNRGKDFEKKLKEDFSKIPESFIYRLPDQTSGFYGGKNVADFFGYKKPYFFLLEAKSISGNTFPITNFTQFEKQKEFVNIPGLRKGVVIWYTEKDRVIYVPLRTIEMMLQDGKKSVNIRTIDSENYDFVDIPSVKKRVFMDSDYSVLLDLPDEW